MAIDMIKKRLMLTAACVLNFTCAQAITVFSPQLNRVDNTFENADFFSFSMPSHYQLGLFDYTDTGFNHALFLQTGDSVSFSPSSPNPVGLFTARNDISGVSISVSTASPSPNTPSFILALLDTNTRIWHQDTFVSPLNTAGSAWSIGFDTTSGMTTSVDIVLSTVPIPTSLWLFATGLVGLVGVARKAA